MPRRLRLHGARRHDAGRGVRALRAGPVPPHAEDRPPQGRGLHFVPGVRGRGADARGVGRLLVAVRRRGRPARRVVRLPAHEGGRGGPRRPRVRSVRPRLRAVAEPLGELRGGGAGRGAADTGRAAAVAAGGGFADARVRAAQGAAARATPAGDGGGAGRCVVGDDVQLRASTAEGFAGRRGGPARGGGDCGQGEGAVCPHPGAGCEGRVSKGPAELRVVCEAEEGVGGGRWAAAGKQGEAEGEGKPRDGSDRRCDQKTPAASGGCKGRGEEKTAQAHGEGGRRLPPPLRTREGSWRKEYGYIGVIAFFCSRGRTVLLSSSRGRQTV